MIQEEDKSAKKKANIRLAIILAAVAILIAMWPLYILKQGIGS